MVCTKADSTDSPRAESPVYGWVGGRSVIICAAVIMLGFSNVMRLSYVSAKLCCFPGGIKSLSREVPSVSVLSAPLPFPFILFIPILNVYITKTKTSQNVLLSDFLWPFSPSNGLLI